MPEYRTYFRDSDGKIKGTQILDCEDDTAAAVKLEILLPLPTLWVGLLFLVVWVLTSALVLTTPSPSS